MQSDVTTPGYSTCNALAPVAPGYPLPSNDQVHDSETCLVAGAPFKASLSTPELARCVRRLDHICALYSAMASPAQIAVDQLVMASLRSLVPLHDRIVSWLESQHPSTQENRSPTTAIVSCSNPLPLGLTALASMILAADAAIDLMYRNATLCDRAQDWAAHYRQHLRKALNRTQDACYKHLAEKNRTLSTS